MREFLYWWIWKLWRLIPRTVTFRTLVLLAVVLVFTNICSKDVDYGICNVFSIEIMFFCICRMQSSITASSGSTGTLTWRISVLTVLIEALFLKDIGGTENLSILTIASENMKVRKCSSEITNGGSYRWRMCEISLCALQYLSKSDNWYSFYKRCPLFHLH